MGSDLDERPGLFQGDVAVFNKGLTKGTFQHDKYMCVYIYIYRLYAQSTTGNITNIYMYIYIYI